jgi:hypothetical protein
MTIDVVDTQNAEIFSKHQTIHNLNPKSVIIWANEEKGSHTCATCGIVQFQYSSHLKNHMKFHQAGKFICVYIGCKQEFDNFQGFKAHATLANQ